jgi:hypothetical protein
MIQGSIVCVYGNRTTWTLRSTQDAGRTPCNRCKVLPLGGVGFGRGGARLTLIRLQLRRGIEDGKTNILMTNTQ